MKEKESGSLPGTVSFWLAIASVPIYFLFFLLAYLRPDQLEALLPLDQKIVLDLVVSYGLFAMPTINLIGLSLGILSRKKESHKHTIALFGLIGNSVLLVLGLAFVAFAWLVWVFLGHGGSH